MENPKIGIEQQILGALAEEAKHLTDEMLKDIFDPAKMMSFIRGMGIDLSGLGSISGQQSGLDPYMVLGLDRSATDGEVRKRYRSLAKALHPDTSNSEGTGFFLQMVIAAYEMIKRERGWQQ